mgnify:CR=1 FL=1
MTAQSLDPNRPVPAAVSIWLWVVAAMIFCMVIVGGATRLTDSGLSITEWQPLLGAIPPLNEADWMQAFEKYKLIPEYQIQNRWMSLEDFKFIYWWEWSHRFLGRTIGIVFFVPFLYFVVTKAIPRRLWPRLALIFVLGGTQGALGWFMVASGLSERTDVSQYRLAAHLSLAVALFAGVVWTALGIQTRRVWQSAGDNVMALLLIPLIFLQIAAGGFVAGLDAGFASNTWPTMNGEWIPAGLYASQPSWRNIFENALTVQFNHRLLGYLAAAAALFTAYKFRAAPSRKWAKALGHMALLQAALGVTAVLLASPLWIGLLHQAGALALFLLANGFWIAHEAGGNILPRRSSLNSNDKKVALDAGAHAH